MKVIEQSANNITPTLYDLVSIKKHIEKCGKVSYKSYGNITSNSYEKFFDNLIKSKHYSVLEHGTVYLTIAIGSPALDPHYVEKMEIVRFYSENPYSKVNKGEEYKKIEDVDTYVELTYYYITTNMRVVIENCRLTNKSVVGTGTYSDLKYQIDEPTDKHHQRLTLHVITDIGVSREFNRHRVFSITERSTRYCDYTKDKFGGELTFIKPNWEVSKVQNKVLVDVFTKIENCYQILKNWDWKPEQAREILPLALETEVVYTGYVEDWQRFIDMRMNGSTGKPHPNMKQLATLINEEINLK